MMIKPAAGLLVRDPQTKQPLPADGAAVELSSFWRRRLAAGDVVEIKAAAPPVEETQDHDDQLQRDPE